VLNDHYAAVSTDANNRATSSKLTASNCSSYVTEWEVFRLLDSLKPTATGLDGLPAWFLRLGAPIFAAPLAELFNQSLTNGVVPDQWKTSIITPIAKVPNPTQAADYRPISVTSILSRLLEKHIVRSYIYPAISNVPQDILNFNFNDQFAFRPFGSTTAAVIALLHTVRSMLSSNEYVHVFSFDLTKAFDSVRHSALMDKMALLQLPDNIYNWINDFFHNRFHCTKFAGQQSSVVQIHASVVQGSGLGPASYIITAADLHPTIAGNRIFKYADDTYLVVPAINSCTRQYEIEHIQSWATNNNLKMNHSKSKELLFAARGKSKVPIQLPTPCMNIERVSSLRVLGVIVNDKLTAEDQVKNILTSCTSLLYALRVLRGHGLPDQSMHDIYRAIIIAKLTYCAPAWSGACTAADKAKLDAFVKKSIRLGYCSKNQPPLTQLFEDIDESFFTRILLNNEHLLHQFLPHSPEICYKLRARLHNKNLLTKTVSLNDQDFLIRMLYKHCY